MCCVCVCAFQSVIIWIQIQIFEMISLLDLHVRYSIQFLIRLIFFFCWYDWVLVLYRECLRCTGDSGFRIHRFVCGNSFFRSPLSLVCVSLLAVNLVIFTNELKNRQRKNRQWIFYHLHEIIMISMNWLDWHDERFCQSMVFFLLVRSSTEHFLFLGSLFRAQRYQLINEYPKKKNKNKNLKTLMPIEFVFIFKSFHGFLLVFQL